jgi:tRNA(Arg) A34 adenosine deaminase TadA
MKTPHHLDHETYMRRALAQARNAPAAPFGAVIVRAVTGEVLAEGYNRAAENPTYHAEIDAINRLAARHPAIDGSALVLYATAEPCPMCQAAIIWAGIPMVVYGTSTPFLKSLGWPQMDIRAEEVARRTPFRHTTVLGGVLEEECNALFLALPRGPFLEKK